MFCLRLAKGADAQCIKIVAEACAVLAVLSVYVFLIVKTIDIQMTGDRLAIGMLFTILVLISALLIILAHRARLLVSNNAYRHALAARQETMAMVAHDLRNPLNTLALASAVIEKNLEKTTDSNDFMLGQMRMIHRTVQYMNKLIGDLTDLARIDTGCLQLERRKCGVDEIVQRAVETVQPLADAKRLSLVQDVADSLPQVFVDCDRLVQALSNLLSNAVKFTPEDGLIQLSAELSEATVRFAVRDSGPGMSAETQACIFERYWQRRADRGGMGMGLFIAKTFVEAHGGRIWVKSSEGRGSTFYVTLQEAS